MASGVLAEERVLKELIATDEWNTGWATSAVSEECDFPEKRLLSKYIPVFKTIFEIGCTPGVTMRWFYETYGCEVSGLDYAGAEVTERYLSEHAVPHEFFACDMFEFDIQKRYDLVISDGVIEHFDDIGPAIEVHKRLAKPGGYVFVVIPNFTHFNRLVARLLGQQRLVDLHNLSIMKPKVLRRYFENDCTYVYANYSHTSLLDIQPPPDLLAAHPTLRKLHSILRIVSGKLHLGNIPNRFFSPHIVVIAQKDESPAE